MQDDASPIRLVVSLDSDPGAADRGEIDGAARNLRNRLRELDVESVELGSGGAIPDGAKSGEAIALGTVLVTVLPAMLPKVVEFLQSWMLRGASRTVKIRAAAGDRSFDVEYSPGVTSERELKDLLASLAGAITPPSRDT